MCNGFCDLTQVLNEGIWKIQKAPQTTQAGPDSSMALPGCRQRSALGALIFSLFGKFLLGFLCAQFHFTHCVGDMYSSEKRWTADLGVVPDRDHVQRHLQSWGMLDLEVMGRKSKSAVLGLSQKLVVLGVALYNKNTNVGNKIEIVKELVTPSRQKAARVKEDSNQDVAIKLAQERAEIVAKYDRGREGAEIEPWEDADYLVYKVTDRFGFLHEEELPYHNAAMERQKHLEIERTTKWLKMLKGWEKYKNTEKVIKNVTSL
ncbi:hypothetical protein EI555_016311 [Monodon monoceros]|uniref:Uncharacterized protein n=1 Tax=Monodon monoceros TaxID=40151 RepID=A0A4U1FF38_MONMO|nr:hypothetical protein EI555_016311 [Monodon monoceros]